MSSDSACESSASPCSLRAGVQPLISAFQNAEKSAPRNSAGDNGGSWASSHTPPPPETIFNTGGSFHRRHGSAEYKMEGELGERRRQRWVSGVVPMGRAGRGSTAHLPPVSTMSIDRSSGTLRVLSSEPQSRICRGDKRRKPRSRPNRMTPQKRRIKERRGGRKQGERVERTDTSKLLLLPLWAWPSLPPRSGLGT